GTPKEITGWDTARCLCKAIGRQGPYNGQQTLNKNATHKGVTSNAVDFGIPNPILTIPNAEAQKTCLEICILHPLFIFSIHPTFGGLVQARDLPKHATARLAKVT
ncbi:MAG: hypothetical protein ACYC3A_07640, partial [Halothiobacillus sp.]